MAESDTNSNGALVNTRPDAQTIATLREALLATSVPNPPDIVPDAMTLNDHEAARIAVLAETLPTWASHIRKMKARQIAFGEHVLYEEHAPYIIEPGWFGATAAQARFLNDTYTEMESAFILKQNADYSRRLAANNTECALVLRESGILPRNKATLFHTFTSLDDSVPGYVREAVYRVLVELLRAEAQRLIDERGWTPPIVFCRHCAKRIELGETVCDGCADEYLKRRREVFGERTTIDSINWREFECWSSHVTNGHQCRCCGRFYVRTRPIDDHGLCSIKCMAYYVVEEAGWEYGREIIDVASYTDATWSHPMRWPALTSAQAQRAYNRAVEQVERAVQEPEPEQRQVKNITPTDMAERLLAAAPRQPGTVTEVDLRRRARVTSKEVKQYKQERDRLVKDGRLGRRGSGTRGSGFEFWAQ